MAGASPASDSPAPSTSPAPQQLSNSGRLVFQFPAQGDYQTYRPLPVPKKAVYVYKANDTDLTTFPAPWDPSTPMKMQGSFYKVFEDLSDPDKGFYGSTVAAMRETNICVKGEELGEGVWVKKGTVSAVQVSGKQLEESDGGGGDGGGGMCVQTWHDDVLETEVRLKKGDWVLRQDGSAKKELMVLGDTNFRKKYERVE